MSARYVFGLHAVDALLRRNPRAVQRLWVQEGRDDKRIRALVELARNQGVSVLREHRAGLDERVSGRHQGAVAEVLESTLEQHPDDGRSILWSEEALLHHVDTADHHVLLLVLDGITDPHNLGACLRSAEAAGVDAVVVPKDKSADLGPAVRKVACGAAEAVPFVRVTNLSRTLAALKDHGVWLYGTAGEAGQTLYDTDLSGPVALVMGSEGSGLRRLTREACDHLVRLPMAGSVSSLNVSVATGVCLFEAVRQRSGAGAPQ
jgi:23S rRNA (guanosine2251-2'-O)-methyltransferase